MFENINAFQIASDLARHASERQSVIASNIANADTPGYRAKDVADFASHFDKWDWASRPFDVRPEVGPGPGDMPMRATRPEHLTDSKPLVLYNRIDAPDSTSPNGNTVTLEGQMVKSAAASSEHDLALALYRSSVNFMRTAIGKAR